jgi:hypothetical protein
MGHEDPEPVTRPAAAAQLESRLGWLGVAFLSLYLGSVYIKAPFARPGVTVGDLIDIAIPMVLIFLYALVGRALGAVTMPSHGRSAPRMLLILGGFALVLGHGMHVAANSIHDAIDRARITDPYGLVNWWDERVSHFAIDFSKIALCVGLTALEGRSHEAGPFSKQGRMPAPGFLALGALAYGFITFAAGVEGQTVALLLPFCVLYPIWSLTRGRPFPPVRRFYTLGAVVSIALFTVWGVWHHGFPEFSAVGLIP